MISISHWGMFQPAPCPPIMIKGMKVADLEAAKREWQKPGGIIEMMPLEIDELQPLYHRLNFGNLD